jgi:hypothetical protein
MTKNGTIHHSMAALAMLLLRAAKLLHHVGDLFFCFPVALARIGLEIAYPRFQIGDPLPRTLALHQRDRLQGNTARDELRFLVVAS